MYSFSVYTITNWQRRDYAVRFLKEMERTTNLNRSPLVVVGNGDSENHDLETYLREKSKVENFRFHGFEERHGLARVWNWCMLTALYEWVVIANDDSIPTESWEGELERNLKFLPHKMILLCHPNGFSAFALFRDFWQKHKYFNNAFPEGYFEDDDWWLKVCYQEGCTAKETRQNLIFSYFDNYGEALFEHRNDIHIPNQRTWDKIKNKEVFDRFWEEVAPHSDGAIENKNGLWYKPRLPSRG